MADTAIAENLCLSEDSPATRQALQRLLDAFPHVAMLVDETHHIVMANTVLAQALERTTDSLVGEYCPKLVHGTDGPFPGCPLEAARKSNRGEVSELFDPASGRWLKSEAYPSEYKTAGGRRVFLHTATDITDAKQADERYRGMLLAAARQWRSTFDAIGHCVCLLDADGNVLRCNKAMATLAGKPFNEIIEHNINDLLYSVVQTDERLTPARIAGLTGRCLSAFSCGGKSFDVAIDPILDEKGAVTGCVHVMVDTTERMALEENLAQAQKLDAIGKLAGGVAHDFNNILSVIMSYAGFLMEELPQGSGAREDAEEIKKAGERAGALTRQLLAFSRKQVINPVNIVTNDVINNLSKMLKRLIGEHIQMTMTFAADTGNVFMDPSQLEQILVNLVVNAKDAMPKGGRLVIETRCAQVDEASAALHENIEPGEYVIITVSDSGIGMDRETQKRVFEPFFTTKPAGKGTGLGLSMVYGAVKQNHGAVTVYSEPGRGTTIRIYLKRVADAVQAEEQAEPAAPRGSGEIVLLVEDEEAVRRAIKKMLEGGGYAVIEADSGETALERYKELGARASLVVSDMIMPGINGLVLAQKLREANPAVKVLNMSGYTDDILTSQGITDGSVPILVKPFERDTLLRRVRALIEA